MNKGFPVHIRLAAFMRRHFTQTPTWQAVGSKLGLLSSCYYCGSRRNCGHS